MVTEKSSLHLKSSVRGVVVVVDYIWRKKAAGMWSSLFFFFFAKEDTKKKLCIARAEVSTLG